MLHVGTTESEQHPGEFGELIADRLERKLAADDSGVLPQDALLDPESQGTAT